MLYIFLASIYIIIVSTERALKDYALDKGQAPDWIENGKKQDAAVERWYVDKADATCKPFTYLGSLGNFNNFVSKSVCLNHLKFTPEGKALACSSPRLPGLCGLTGIKALKRFYFSKTSVGGKENDCHLFDYTGCGGNANNFESIEECKNVCQNNVNGGMNADSATNTMTATPNKFDCTFIPEVKTDNPIMGIVPHKDGNRCVYAAVGKGVKRGFFNDMPMCVKTCIMPACNAEGPHQVETTDEVTTTNAVETYYYFDKGQSLCLPFMSKPPDPKTNIDGGKLNIFKSAELCASYCPATGHIGRHKAVRACTLQKSGQSTNTDKYKIERYFYDQSVTNGEKCTKFDFNGKEMNLNNFKSREICKAICETPLSTGQ